VEAEAAGKRCESELERKIFELILSFPERIDAMETRSEESSLALAKRICRLVASEMEGSDPVSPEPPPGGSTQKT
jgi:hypothetical protein